MTASDAAARPDAATVAGTLEDGVPDQAPAADENPEHTRLMVIPESARSPRRPTTAQTPQWASSAQEHGRRLYSESGRLYAKGKERMSALRPLPRPVLLGIGGVVLLAALIVAFSVGAGSGGSASNHRPSDLPSGVPSHLKQPLQGLHNSLDGKSS
jgi:hypothetical protein